MSEVPGEQPQQPHPQQPPPQQPQFNPQTGVPPTPPPYQPYAGYAPEQPAWAAPGMPTFPTYVIPDLPKATAALVVGIVAVAGGLVFCGLPLLVAPVAWVLGAQARREIRAAPQRWSGEGRATAGLVLGVIGSVLLVLALIVVVIIVVIAVNDPNAFDSNTGV